jgi:hypothetical protein
VKWWYEEKLYINYNWVKKEYFYGSANEKTFPFYTHGSLSGEQCFMWIESRETFKNYSFQFSWFLLFSDYWLHNQKKLVNKTIRWILMCIRLQNALLPVIFMRLEVRKDRKLLTPWHVYPSVWLQKSQICSNNWSSMIHFLCHSPCRAHCPIKKHGSLSRFF